MAINKRFPVYNVFGEEELPNIEIHGLRPYRLGDGPRNRYFVRDNMVIEKRSIVVHTITMGDVEDPDLFVSEPIWQWQQTLQGQWVMENATQPPIWNRMADPVMWGHKYIITAEFEGKKLTEYYLRFGSSKKP